jgi:16S rRNA (guanine(527)-N(7))-methyltransferase RsmG
MYIDILLRWNARINLTAIRDPEEIVTRHFGESLFAARHLFPRSPHVGTAPQACPERSRRGAPAERSSALTVAGGEAANRGRAALQGRDTGMNKKGALAPGASDQRPTTNDRPTVADVGSGAGFPGLPFKIWDPSISLTLIESNQKKATFLREVARAITLTDVNIQNARAESLAGRTFDVVTLRAVEHFEAILPVAADLVAPAGSLALLLGAAQLDRARSLLPNLEWSAPIAIPASRSRVLLQAHRIG